MGRIAVREEILSTKSSAVTWISNRPASSATLRLNISHNLELSGHDPEDIVVFRIHGSHLDHRRSPLGDDHRLPGRLNLSYNRQAACLELTGRNPSHSPSNRSVVITILTIARRAKTENGRRFCDVGRPRPRFLPG